MRHFNQPISFEMGFFVLSKGEPMNDKIQIRVICPACSGHAFLTTGDEMSIVGRKYKRLAPCSACGGTGKQTQTISMVEYARLQDAIMAEEQL
jgi:hypothetical protein